MLKSAGNSDILINDIVVERKIVFNDEGSNALRCIRERLQQELTESLGREVTLPYPTVIHIALLDYANLKGITIHDRRPKAS